MNRRGRTWVRPLFPERRHVMQDPRIPASTENRGTAASVIPKWLFLRVSAGRGLVKLFRRLEAALGPRLDAAFGAPVLALPFLRQVFDRLEARLRTLVEAAARVASVSAAVEELRDSSHEVREELFETYREFRDILRHVFGPSVTADLGIPRRTPTHVKGLCSVVRRLQFRLTEERKRETAEQGPGYVRVDFDHHLSRLSALETELAGLGPPLLARQEQLAEARRVQEEAVGRFDESFSLASGLFEPLLCFADLAGPLERAQDLRRRSRVSSGLRAPASTASSPPR